MINADIIAQTPEGSFAEVFALKSLKLTPGSARDAVEGFRKDPTGLEVKIPEANGYEFQSHGVLRKLEKLQEEMNSKHVYDLPMHVQQGALAEVSTVKSSKLIPGSAKDTVDAFRQGPKGLEVESPEAHGYEFQSHGVVRMLGKLLGEFTDECTKIEQDEISPKHAHDLLRQAQEGSLVEVSAGVFEAHPRQHQGCERCVPQGSNGSRSQERQRVPIARRLRDVGEVA